MSETAFIAAKNQLVERILSCLVAQGYSRDDRRKLHFVDSLRDSLGGKTTWNPDIFLIHSNGTVLVADAQLLEERQAQYIPAAMEQAAPRINSILPNAQIALYIPMGWVLTTDTICKAARLNIAVEAIDQSSTIHRLLNPSTICQTFRPTQAENEAIQRQKASGWVIPRVLVQRLNNVTNLEYSNQLHQFASSYFGTPTPIRLSTQYKIASQCIESIFRSLDLNVCCEPLLISKDLQKMARRKGESRDHFLHEFQTFLIGALILDGYTRSPSSPFILCGRYRRLDIPWLIASIFHDFGFDLANLESCVNIPAGELKYEPKGNVRFSALLNSLYDFQKNTDNLDNWNPDSYIVGSSDLERILFSAALEKSSSKTGERLRANHGALSAHNIACLAERVSAQRPNLAPIFISSALSASLHDKNLWPELFSGSILPLDASRFPLLYLLVLCDTLAEAGRPRTAKIEREDAVLASFSIQGNIVRSSVWFPKLERACTMNFWSHFVQERCFANALLRFECRSLL
jgi:hypothetical protein